MAKTISMTNISAEPVRISIGGQPGEEPTVYTIPPGGRQDFPEGYCVPVRGRGPEIVPSILARQSTRTWPDGTRRPTLVPTSEVRQAKSPPQQRNAS